MGRDVIREKLVFVACPCASLHSFLWATAGSHHCLLFSGDVAGAEKNRIYGGGGDPFVLSSTHFPAGVRFFTGTVCTEKEGNFSLRAGRCTIDEPEEEVRGEDATGFAFREGGCWAASVFGFQILITG